ncbi:hypothetical protein GCK32_007233 [Trichostrongylus colubriformis]|uniref:Uncharacterized protein n=1 Tax=Trichostrongylus colubriformis TaxID=6319 RepID=A0AAN8IR25_TRICO
MRLAVSDLDLRRLEFCLGKRTKAVGIVIGVIDVCSLTTAFVKCIQLLQHFGYTPIATFACYSIGVLYTSHLIAILACWYGITRELSSWIVPKIVLKCTTVMLLIAITCILSYFISKNPSYFGGVIARGLNVDYLEHKSAIDFGTIVLVTITAAVAMGQIWLLLLLIGCYRDTRKKELRRLLEEALRVEKSKEEQRQKEEKGMEKYEMCSTTKVEQLTNDRYQSIL